MKKLLLPILITVIVACVCIFVAFIGLSALGTIGLLQMNSTTRDTQRKDVMHTLGLNITAYYTNNAVFPSEIIFDKKEIKIKGEKDGVDVKGATSPSDKTSDLGTIYCYGLDSTYNYFLGVKLESGEWVQYGNSSTNCSDNTDKKYLSK